MSGFNGHHGTPIVAELNVPIQAPPSWQWVRLTDVARLESGHTPSRSKPEYWGGNVKWLSLKDVRRLDDKYIDDTTDHPTQLGIDNSSARILPKGTVALCRTASVGKSVILNCAMATSQDFVNWICGPKLLPEYLYYSFRHSNREFERLQQGTTHKTIYMPTAEQFALLLPPLAEQRRIAAILDKADAIRRKREEGIRLTEELLRSTFLDMFGDSVVNARGWQSTTVGDVSEVQGGLQLSPIRKTYQIQAPYLRVANVYRDRLMLEEIKEIGCTAIEFERVRLRTGDILLIEGHGNQEEIGRTAVWDGSIEPCLHQNHLIRVRVKAELIDPIYLCAFLNSSSGRLQLNRFGKTTSGLNTINISNVRQVRVLLPPIQIQKHFATLVRRIKTTIRRREMAYEESEHLFSALVQRAFRREI